MKMKNLEKLFVRARKIIGNFGDFFRSCGENLGKLNCGMNDKELGIFMTMTFYLFSMFLGISIMAIPIMAFLSYPAIMIVVTFLSIGLAFPATIVVMGTKYSHVFISNMVALFEKYSLPLIGLKKSGEIIYKVQTKIFRLFMNAFGISIGCYILSKILALSQWEIVSVAISIIILCASWEGVFIMSLNGIFIYFTCLVELAVRLLTRAKMFVKPIHWKIPHIKISFKKNQHKVKNIYLISLGKAKRLKKMDRGTIQLLFKETFLTKQRYEPKRLAVGNHPNREKSFSLKKLAIDMRAKCLNARRMAFYINGSGHS